MAYLLIVDDDEDFASAAETMLQRDGHEISIALTTEEGLDSMKARKPDLAILDVMFPESSVAGFELVRTMQHEDQGLRDVPVLMLTAVNAKFPLGFSRNDIDDKWMPATDFIEKPVMPEALRAKVTEMLAQAAARAEP